MQLISIIIPVYNHWPELKQALRSIQAQTQRPLEVIIVDDGSQAPIAGQIDAREFGLEIKLHRQANQGAAAARNAGFAISRGEFVIFWDADVIAMPAMLQKMHNVLTLHPEASYVYSDFFYGKKKMPAQKFDARDLRKKNYIMTTSLVRRDNFAAFDEKLKRFQDWDLWLTLSARGQNGIYIPEFLFTVTPRKNGISFWLPGFAYKKPWSWLPGIRRKVREFNKAKKIIADKHRL